MNHNYQRVSHFSQFNSDRSVCWPVPLCVAQAQVCERALCARERRQLSAVGLSCIVVVVVAGASLLLESYRCFIIAWPATLIVCVCVCVCVHVWICVCACVWVCEFVFCAYLARFLFSVLLTSSSLPSRNAAKEPNRTQQKRRRIIERKQTDN